VKEQLNADIYSPDAKTVLKAMHDLGHGMGIIKKNIDPLLLESKPKWYAEQVLGSFDKGLPSIHVGRLENNRKQINALTDYGRKNQGFLNLLNGLSGALEKDMLTSSNADYLKYLHEARDFTKKNVGNRMRESIALSILNGKAPKDAYNQMNSVEDIRILKRVTGDSENGQKVFNALAKAKTRDILSKSVNEDWVKPGAFTDMLAAGKKETRQEVLSELIGPYQYKKLEDVAKITKAYQKAGQDILNTSGTAIATADITKGEAMIKASLQMIYGGIGAGIGYEAGDLGGAAAGAAAASIGIPYMLSRLMANPKFVNMTREYALARQAGKEQKAKQLLNGMINEAKVPSHEAIDFIEKHGAKGIKGSLDNLEEEEKEK